MKKRNIRTLFMVALMSFAALQVCGAKGAFEKRPAPAEEDPSLRPAVEEIVGEIMASAPEVPSVTEEDVKDIVGSLIGDIPERPSVSEEDVRGIVGSLIGDIADRPSLSEDDVENVVRKMLEALPEAQVLTEDDVKAVVSAAIEDIRASEDKVTVLSEDDVRQIASALIEELRAETPAVPSVTADEVSSIVSGLIDEAKSDITLITEDDVKSIAGSVIAEREKSQEPFTPQLTQDDVRTIIADILEERDSAGAPAITAEDVSRIVTAAIEEASAKNALTAESVKDMIARAFIERDEAENARKAEEEARKQSWIVRQASQADFSYDLYFRSIKNRTSDFSLGGGLNMGVKTNNFKFELYGLGDYFMKPLGGDGGAATLEFMVETGAMFGWKILDVWRTQTYLCVDLGYFMQFAATSVQPENVFMAYNGIMARLKLMTELRISKHYDMGIGFFYQFPLYPEYDEYAALGAMVSIL